MENIDNPTNSFPDDIRDEIRTMSGWMQALGILSIIGTVLGILSTFSAMAQGQAGASSVLTLGLQGFGIYVAVILLQKATHFRNFSASSSGDDLLKAMKGVHQYWMYSVIMFSANIIISIVFRS